MNFLSKINEKYKGNDEKKGFYLIAAIPWIVAVLWTAVWMLKKGYISYEVNDDAFLNLIVSGTFGKKYAMNVYNNVLFGWILTALYSISKNHNWYTLTEYVICFGSIMVLGISNIRRNKIVRGYLTNIVILLATTFSLICRMNYSKTGAIAMLAGLYLMGSCADREDYEERGNLFFGIVGGIFFFFGGLLRKDTVYAVAPFAALLLLYLILKYKNASIKRAVPLFAAGVLLCAAWVANACAYNSNPDWKYYNEYNKARTDVLDFGVPDYSQNRESYEAMGLTETDILMLGIYYFADDEVFSIDRLNQIVELREKNKEKVPLSERLKNTAEAFVRTAGSIRTIYVFLFLFLVGCINTDKKKFGYQLCAVLLAAGEVLWLIWINRTPDRSVFVPAVSCIVLLLFFFSKEQEDSFKRVVETVCILLVGIYTFYACGVSTIKKQYEQVSYDRTYSDCFFEYIEEHSENLYVYNVLYEDQFLMKCYSPLDHTNDVSRANAVTEGGWPVPSPVYTDIISQYGEKYNLFRTLAESDDVFWIVNKDSEKYIFGEYMKLHYGVSAVVVDNIAGLYDVVYFE